MPLRAGEKVHDIAYLTIDKQHVFVKWNAIFYGPIGIAYLQFLIVACKQATSTKVSDKQWVITRWEYLCNFLSGPLVNISL